jgi:hypothetical protein
MTENRCCVSYALAFLQGPLHVEVWLWETGMQEYSLGRALCLEATGGLAYAYAPA